MPEDLGLQKAGCCRAKMPLGGSARCEVPAEPALRPPRLEGLSKHLHSEHSSADGGKEKKGEY